jgi:hypothetical protein
VRVGLVEELLFLHLAEVRLAGEIGIGIGPRVAFLSVGPEAKLILVGISFGLWRFLLEELAVDHLRPLGRLILVVSWLRFVRFLLGVLLEFFVEFALEAQVFLLLFAFLLLFFPHLLLHLQSQLLFVCILFARLTLSHLRINRE